MINLKRNKGFTIVELVVVLAIIAILILIAVPQYTRYIQRAQDTRFNAEGAEIYTAIIQGTEQLMLAGEDPYDEDALVPIINQIMRTRNAGGTDTITIAPGMDEMLDIDNNQTWGLVIDEEEQTITYNNQVDVDHNYVFVNGVIVDNFVPPDDGGGDDGGGDDGGGDDGGGDDGGGDDGGGDDGGGDDGGGDDGGGDDGGGSDDPTLDEQAALITQAVYDARVILKQQGRDTNNLFTCTEITNMIQNTQSLRDSLKPVFGNDNAGNHIMNGTDTNKDKGYWGLQVVETGVYDDKNLDNDDIIITNLTPSGLYTYKNGEFVSKS